MSIPKILVLCTGNSCRSQMAEGYLRHHLGDKAEVFSAGVETHGLNPRAVQVMAEDGLDISHHESILVDTYLNDDFAVVLTVCDHAQEVCPVFPGKVGTKLHHSFSDPAKAKGSEEEVMDAFRKTRDAIREWSRAFVAQHFAE